MYSVAFGPFHERGNENLFELVVREVVAPEEIPFTKAILKACCISYVEVFRTACPSIILSRILIACLTETSGEFVELLSLADLVPYISVPAARLVKHCAALIAWEQRSENFRNILEFHYGRGMKELDGKYFAKLIEYQYIVRYFGEHGGGMETVRIGFLFNFLEWRDERR